MNQPVQAAPPLALLISVLAPETVVALLEAGYVAGRADALGLPPPVDGALAHLLQQVRDVVLPTRPVGAVPRAPHENTRNITLAALCARECLPLPPASEAQSVLRGYTCPSATKPYWTLTNTGGRCYRFWPLAESDVIERRIGGVWQAVPRTQVPRIIQVLRPLIGQSA